MNFDYNKNIHARLQAALTAREETPRFDPVQISPYVAMSLLQKAVRRGHETLALRAAATLLIEAPDKLWRRCGGIAWEDIGLADMAAVEIVTASLAGKRIRAELGGEWGIASLAVSALVAAIKCRAADDLLMSSELHPDFSGQRRLYATARPDVLTAVVLSDTAIQERALALWYLLGTDRFNARHLVPRRGTPSVAFECLRQAGISEATLEIAAEGYRKTRSALPVLVALLSLYERDDHATVKDDRFPPQQTIGQVPGWAYDLYSREGRHCLGRFLESDCQTAKWITRRFPPPDRISFLGGLVFCIEGGQCSQRLRWPTAEALREQVHFECRGLEAFDALEQLRSDIVILNEVRDAAI